MKILVFPLFVLSILMPCIVLGQDSSTGSSKNRSYFRGTFYEIAKLRLATRDPGIIKKIHFELGDRVKVGDPIISLDSRLYVAELNAAKREAQIAELQAENDVDLRFAETSAAVSRKQVERSNSANQQFPKTVTQQEIDQLKLELNRSELSGEQAEMSQQVNRLTSQLRRDQLRIAELRLEYREVKSELDGYITKLNYTTAGEYVSAGATIAEIVNVDRLKFSFQVSLSDLSLFAKGAEFEIVVDRDIERFTVPCEIIFVNRILDPQSKRATIWAMVDNSDGKLIAGEAGQLQSN